MEKIAALMDKPVKLASHREFTTWRAELDGKAVIVCSTGIGGPSTSIAVEELAQLGIRTFLRIAFDFVHHRRQREVNFLEGAGNAALQDARIIFGLTVGLFFRCHRPVAQHPDAEQQQRCIDQQDADP
ncbi:hypothetical protein SDC9_159474 [bioreactor metagenome]|uniref:Uridine phosphorylase n=1 Tax=bioreactor metagenome TaxID=1076179 RepID=A0A645FFA5_9ZZZZ